MSSRNAAAAQMGVAQSALGIEELESGISRATEALLEQQRADGHWAFELEADATIPAEYVLLRHFLAEINGETEQKIAVYLRKIQGEHGGWPLFHEIGRAHV